MSVGVEKSKEAVSSVAKLVSMVSEAVHGGGWLLKIYPIVLEAQKLVSVDLQALKAEAADLSTEEGKELEQAWKDNLVLVKKDVEVKIEDAVDCVREAVELGAEVVAKGAALVQKVKALVS